ncbi:MAG: pantoate--beta-alanine ligase [Magnetococcales bacterium]|nr:pantoate--beta-alanine ligase [Magnetococcales bacterium]
MKFFEKQHDLSLWVDRCRGASESVGFVPTMGGLHEGHLSLIRAAKEKCDRVVASIFVNPTQFGPGEDFERYPRELQQDRELLAGAGCDGLFYPTVEEIYPQGHQTRVSVEPLGSQLCGAFRPGHFEGVATVVTVLLNLVRPHRIFLGLKDYQQFILLRQMVGDLGLGVVVEGVSTVREADGLALSSRNRYLDREGRERALGLYRAMEAVSEAWQGGERNPEALEGVGRQVLVASGIDRIDYVAVRDSRTLGPWNLDSTSPQLLIAAFVDGVRLIDNRLLTS